MSLNQRPDHISEADWLNPKLNPKFWDCECDGGPDQYIKHKATQLFCDECGAHEDEMPDSHQREVEELCPFNIDEGHFTAIRTRTTDCDWGKCTGYEIPELGLTVYVYDDDQTRISFDCSRPEDDLLVQAELREVKL